MNIKKVKTIIETIGKYVMERYGSIAVSYDPKKFRAGNKLRIYFSFKDPNSKSLTEINDYAKLFNGGLYPGNVKNNNCYTALLAFP